MPNLDVSEALTDPDLLDSFQVIRRMQQINQFGEVGATQNATFSARGVVVPTGDQSLVREEAMQSQAKTIEVYTQFRLRGVSETLQDIAYQPDIIVWHGDNFVVRLLDDLTGYGTGFVHAECSSIDFVDQPPPQVGQ